MGKKSEHPNQPPVKNPLGKVTDTDWERLFTDYQRAFLHEQDVRKACNLAISELRQAEKRLARAATAVADFDQLKMKLKLIYATPGRTRSSRLRAFPGVALSPATPPPALHANAAASNPVRRRVRPHGDTPASPCAALALSKGVQSMRAPQQNRSYRILERPPDPENCKMASIVKN